MVSRKHATFKFNEYDRSWYVENNSLCSDTCVNGLNIGGVCKRLAVGDSVHFCLQERVGKCIPPYRVTVSMEDTRKCPSEVPNKKNRTRCEKSPAWHLSCIDTVLSFLSVRDIFRCSSVSKEFASAASRQLMCMDHFKWPAELPPSEIVHIFKRMGSLKSLDMRDCVGLDPNDVNTLHIHCDVSKLESLDISSGSYHEKTFQRTMRKSILGLVVSATSLKHLNVSGRSFMVTPDDIVELKLESLVFQANWASSLGMKAIISRCSHLRDLRTYGSCRMDDSALNLMGPGFEVLCLSSCPAITTGAMCNFIKRNGGTLKTLSLKYGHCVTDEVLGSIRDHCTTLHTLALRFIKNDLSVDKLREVLVSLGSKLTSLELSITNVDDTVLRTISTSCSHLERIVLIGCSEITNKGFDSLDKCKQLNDIVIQKCPQLGAQVLCGLKMGTRVQFNNSFCPIEYECVRNIAVERGLRLS